MQMGVAYYPEHEKATQWSVDYKKMQGAGIKRIRIAEFAWACLEPVEGEYQWDWLDQAIDLAAEYGIEVVLCTPTACPPIWLVERYPEVLPVHKSGKTVGFGARQHRSYFSPKYNEYSLRLVTLMAERYGQHTNVVAWQLDNEFGGETKFDYSEGAKKAFHQYLAEKFGTIESLNERWGTVFWSQQYQSWEQIQLPATINSDVPMWPHPSLELEFIRFSSSGIIDYAEKQIHILRQFIGSRRITTNGFMFCWGDSVDWARLFAKLDVVGMDIYSNQPHEIAFYSDASRSVLNKPFWILEYGASAPNLNRDMQIIHERGCSQFFLFKMKPFPWGQEQGGRELLTLTGEPAPNYHVVRNYTELHQDESELSVVPFARIGLYYHFESSWSYKIAVHDRLDVPVYIVDNVYKSFYESYSIVDIIYTPQQIKDYEILIVPLHVIYDEALEESLLAYVQSGGKLIATSDLFRKNEDNVFLTAVPKLFSVLFGWHENNFVTDVLPKQKAILLEQTTGKGKAYLVARDTTLEGWQQLIEKVATER